MAYGLLLKNKDGVVVLNTSSNVLNAETIATTSVVVPVSGSVNVTVPDVHIPEAVVVDLVGGDEDITTTTATNTLTINNVGAVDRTLLLETWRLL